MGQKSEEHIHYTREEQGELFTEFQATKAKKPAHPLRRGMVFGKKFAFNLSYENIVLLFIAFIMLLVVFFSLGVEKGKRIILHTKISPAETPQIIEEPEIVETDEITEKKLPEPSLKPYTIQVVAFKKEEKARQATERLKNDGYKAFVIPSKEWLQVCVGRYINKEESKKDFADLKKMYPTSYFRKISE